MAAEDTNTQRQGTFHKPEHLYLKREIDSLFAGGESFIAYPFRISMLSVERNGAPVKAMVVAQKKRFRHAVDRVRVKRQMREAYRLAKAELIADVEQTDRTLLISFIFVAKDIEPTAFVMTKMKDAIAKVRKRFAERVQ